MTSGIPDEAAIKTQWTAVGDVLETQRVSSDALTAAGGEFDVLEQALHGTWTPQLAGVLSDFRSTLSSLSDRTTASAMLEPVLREYANRVVASRDGKGFDNIDDIVRAIYDHMARTSKGVTTRAITFEAITTPSSPEAGGTGNGTLYRLAEDWNGQPMEACHVETKVFRCRQDQNTGAKPGDERFEIVGDTPSDDALQLGASHSGGVFGSGPAPGGLLRIGHAGSASSLLNNGSFTTFDDTATPKFSAWTQSFTGATASDITSSTTIYRNDPTTSSGGSTALSASLTVTSGESITLTQKLSEMRQKRLDIDTPYFCRVMYNNASATDGTLTLTLGGKTAAVDVSTGSGWQELRIGDSTLAASEDPSDCWFRNVNLDDLELSIDYTSGATGGTLLLDDAILTPWDFYDGTYWKIVGGTTDFLLDDYFEITDTGGAPGTGILQWWMWVAFGAYLPTTGTIIPDPTI